jgi:hypothetical protein
MKPGYASSTIILLCLLAACQKQVSETFPDREPQSNKNCRLAKMIQGFPGNDTTFILHYNESNAIDMILYKYPIPNYDPPFDTLKITNNGNGMPVSMVEEYSPGKFSRFNWQWNSYNMLTQFDGFSNQYRLTYQNDTILNGATTYFYSTSGVWQQSSTTIDMGFNSNYDITRWKSQSTYSSTERNYTYTDIKNPIKEIFVFNIINLLGINDISPFHPLCIAPSKLVKRIEGSTDTYDISYEFNDKQQLVKSVSLFTRNREVLGNYTRFYYYECD